MDGDRVECPFCKSPQVVREPMGDGDTDDMDCKGCGATFIVAASTTIHYSGSCPDGKHDLLPSASLQDWGTCSRCRTFAKLPIPF